LYCFVFLANYSNHKGTTQNSSAVTDRSMPSAAGKLTAAQRSPVPVLLLTWQRPLHLSSFVACRDSCRRNTYLLMIIYAHLLTFFFALTLLGTSLLYCCVVPWTVREMCPVIINASVLCGVDTVFLTHCCCWDNVAATLLHSLLALMHKM